MAQTATVSPVFQINRSSFSQSQSLSFLFNRSRKVRSVNLGNSTLKASAVWTAEKNFRIWSIRDDLQLPPSYSYAQGGQRPPAMLREHFQSVISQLFQHRIILCSGAVDDDKANVIVAQLLYLDVVDPNKDIIMYVNSPGGSVTAGLAIFDTMRQVRPDISTVCVGFAASMGAFLLSAGTKGKTTRSTLHYMTGNLRLISSYIDKNITGKRYSYPNSRIMIHKPFGKAQGSQTDIGILANEVLLHKANLIRYLSYHTGQSLEKINKDTDRDFFMSAIEAKQYGLIDDVILNPLKAFPPLAATPAVESESQSSVFPQ